MVIYFYIEQEIVIILDFFFFLLSHQTISYELCQAKKCLGAYAKCTVSDHPTHGQSLHSYILKYPMILRISEP